MVTDATYNTRLAYLWDDAFKIKWGIITYMIRRFSYLHPYRILDLGCGPITVIDYLEKKNVERYVGVDHNEDIIAQRKKFDSWEYICSAIEDVKVEKDAFNIIVWGGIGPGYTQWVELIKRIQASLEERGILILEYHDTWPKAIKKRLLGTENFAHITGLRYDLDYTSPDNMLENPMVYQRRCEVLMKRWGARL